MTDAILAELERSFGFTTFRPGQREVVEHLLAGRAAAAVFPTGGGKSLCYQLPALLLPGVAVVVSPLIALMKDQIDALVARGIAASRLDSTLSASEYRTVMDDARAGRLRMLYVAPERFNNERFREAMQHMQVSLFAVDEAHCISEWGHNFRPDYLKLAEFARMCRVERRLALTATATPKVLEDICQSFQVAPECAVRTGFYRPNLIVNVRAVEDHARDVELLRLLQEREAGPTIVYVTLQRTAEALARRLEDAGFPARPYHAGLGAEQRAATQEWFMGSGQSVVVATIAFGMGIDKADIRYVYHYNAPKSLENYAQEIGRAGRDGALAICETLFCPDDLHVLENFAYGDTPELSAVRGLVGELFSGPDRIDVSLHDLSARHDIRPLVVRTLLTYLELDGRLEGGTPFYSSYQFKPLASSAEILARFEGERRDFLAGLLRQAVKGRTWFRVDAAAAGAALGADRQRVVRALDHLAERALLEVRSSGVRHRYRRLGAPPALDALAEDLHGRTEAREAAEIERLHQFVALAGMDGCLVRALAGHFGEDISANCGHCSWCNGARCAESTLRPRPAAVDPALLGEALGLDLAAIADPRSLARFLCGVSSPRLARAKLGAHRLFGAMQHVPFPQVLACCAEAVGGGSVGRPGPQAAFGALPGDPVTT